MKESFYGFQKLGIHNKFVQLYLVKAICCILGKSRLNHTLNFLWVSYDWASLFIFTGNENHLVTLTPTLVVETVSMYVKIFTELKSKLGNLMCEFWDCIWLSALFSQRILVIVTWLIYMLALQTLKCISGLVLVLIPFNCLISWQNRVLSCSVNTF